MIANATSKPSVFWAKLFVIHNIVTLFVIHNVVHNIVTIFVHNVVHNVIHNTILWHF